MKPFHPLQTEIGKPEQFNNPFCYEPHPLSILAAEEVQRYITENADIKEDADKGKMFGVLVVEAPHRKRDETLGFLAAYSGLLAGKNSWSWFVPPIFNAQKRFGYFKMNESRLTKMNREVDALEKRLNKLLNSADYLKMQQTVENLLSEHEQKMKSAKALRDMKRLQKNISPEEHAELVRESQFMKAEMRRIKKRCKEMARPWKEKEQSLREKIEQLKKLRKESSDELQRWLFSQYKMRNAEGEQKDILDIFADYSGQLPPAGAGDCCAPKLLQYAFEHHLKPLCMAEFWWGESPKMEIRHHLHYYPACRGKCLPILTWMILRNVEPTVGAYGESQCGMWKSTKQLPPDNYLYEDDYLIVLNKPAGMLSVPGKSGEESVESIIRERLHDEVNPLIVHRLDMDTSGLMVVAKNKWAYTELQKEFLTHQVQKSYVALLERMPEDKPFKGTITLPLRPDIYDRPRQLVDNTNGKDAVTEYEIMGGLGDKHPRVVLRPKTGRTHQLRIHCAHQQGLGVPIWGDALYGQRADRLYLHAETLSFIHPKTGERLTFRESAPF